MLLCRFTHAVDSINTQLQQFASTREAIHVSMCGHFFLDTAHPEQIHSELMPDGLNLSQDGMELFASCLEPTIQVFGKVGIDPVMDPTLLYANLSAL